MHKILKEIQRIIDENMAFYLPHVKSSDLEKDGAIFYMNGNNGTEFDWYVNDKLSPFMVFYDDKENLGAAKLILYHDGYVEVYLYDEQGKKFIKTVHTNIESNKTDILKLAVILKNEADDKRIWDADIACIHTDMEPNQNVLDEFQSQQQNYAVMKNRRNILNSSAYVSKKITEEGYKVCYMERNEPNHEKDSGWFFASGTEDDVYLSDDHNIELISVGMVWQQLDPDIFRYIDMPIGTRMIRISEENFEIDQNDKEIYVMKR